MKKTIIHLSAIVSLMASLGAVTVKADSIINEQSVDTIQRVTIRAYQFSSKPPKKYKGMTLIRERKVNSGYMGYYV